MLEICIKFRDFLFFSVPTSSPFLIANSDQKREASHQIHPSFCPWCCHLCHFDGGAKKFSYFISASCFQIYPCLLNNKLNSYNLTLVTYLFFSPKQYKLSTESRQMVLVHSFKLWILFIMSGKNLLALVMSKIQKGWPF